MKRGEDELACALRELEEETGIAARQVAVVDGFRFEATVFARSGRPRGGRSDRKKTVVLFAAEVEGPVAVVTPDHDDYAWVPWHPPHDLDESPVIHAALQAWQEHLQHGGHGVHGVHGVDSKQRKKAS